MGGFQLPCCRFWPYPARSSSIQTSYCTMMWILFHQPVYWEGTIVLKTDHWISTKGWSRWHMPSPVGNCHLYIHALWSRYVSMYTYNIYIYTCYMILYCNEEQDMAPLLKNSFVSSSRAMIVVWSWTCLKNNAFTLLFPLSSVHCLGGGWFWKFCVIIIEIDRVRLLQFSFRKSRSYYQKGGITIIPPTQNLGSLRQKWVGNPTKLPIFSGNNDRQWILFETSKC